MARRALIPLPLLLAVPLRTPGADTFSFVEGGVSKELTEIQARDALTKKVEAATAAGKGLDVNRRGQFNEKALFAEDFYFKYGLRPTPEDLKSRPPDELPFAPIQRRYTGYKKFNERITAGLGLYAGDLRTAVQDSMWPEIATLLEKGAKGKGSNKQGEGTGIAASELRSSCRAMGLFGNTVLQSENDSGTTTVNLLVRHLVNEAYFAMDDIAEAAQEGDKGAAKAAWTRGKEYLNAYVDIINRPINDRVGDKFGKIEASL